MMDILYHIFIFPIEQLIGLFYKFAFVIFRDPALSILSVSVAVGLFTLPLYNMAERHQNAERDLQKRMKPEVDKIKAVFSGNERFMRLSTFYRQNGYHHLYFLRTSISLLIQIPFFIAAFHYLSHLEIIRNISFGPIEDLAKPDSLLKFNNITINILPFVMTAINLTSSAIYSKGLLVKDKIQLYGMATIFLVLLYHSPSGMVLYWTGNNIFSLFKNIIQKARLKKLKPEVARSIFNIHLPEKNNNTVALVLGLFILFLLFGLVIPSSLIASSVQEFSFIDEYKSPVHFILITASQSLGIFIFWPLCIYWMASERNKKYILTAVMVFTGIALVNVFLFPGKYGYLTTEFILSDNINPGGLLIILNLFTVIIVSIIAFAAVWRFRKVMMPVLMITICAFILICTINITKIGKEFQSYQKHYVEKNMNTDKYMYSFSKNGKNIILIMLDTAVSGYLPYIFDERPALKESFDGFTWYRNTVSLGAHTNFGVPGLFGGYEYTPSEMDARNDIPLVKKHNEALLLLPKLLMERGYRINITDPPYSNYSYYGDLSIFNDYPQTNVNNIIGKYNNKQWLANKKEEQQPIKISSTIESCLIRFSFFKTSPAFFRSTIYNEGRWLVAGKTNMSDNKYTLNNYIALDVLPDITKIDETPVNTYNVITNNLPHEPCFLKLPDYVPSNYTITDKGNGPFADEGFYHVNMAALILVGKWFDYLKDNGVYDNTRIIIVSDHGNPRCKSYSNDIVLPNGELLQSYAAFLLVKDFNSHGVLSINDEFMTNADVPVIALKDIIERPVNPWTGKMLKADKDNGVTLTTSHLWNLSDHPKYQFKIKSNEWLHVHDNIFKMENWDNVSK